MNNKTYPTRFQHVGTLKCFFVSCYRKGQIPLCSVGTTWPFTLLMVCYALGITSLFLYFDQIVIIKKNPTEAYISYGLLTINLIALAMGILGDPGIPHETYMSYNEKHL